jgi:hypothetical protein
MIGIRCDSFILNIKAPFSGDNREHVVDWLTDQTILLLGMLDTHMTPAKETWTPDARLTRTLAGATICSFISVRKLFPRSNLDLPIGYYTFVFRCGYLSTIIRVPRFRQYKQYGARSGITSAKCPRVIDVILCNDLFILNLKSRIFVKHYFLEPIVIYQYLCYNSPIKKVVVV